MHPHLKAHMKVIPNASESREGIIHPFHLHFFHLPVVYGEPHFGTGTVVVIGDTEMNGQPSP